MEFAILTRQNHVLDSAPSVLSCWVTLEDDLSKCCQDWTSIDVSSRQKTIVLATDLSENLIRIPSVSSFAFDTFGITFQDVFFVYIFIFFIRLDTDFTLSFITHISLPVYLNQHCSSDDSTTRPLILVTASVDRMVLKKPIRVDIDLKIMGAVTWVGRSSMEIQLEVTQSSEGIF